MASLFRCMQSVAKSSQLATLRSLKQPMSTSPTAPLLLTPRQLRDAPQNQVVTLDASWFLPNIPRNPKEEFRVKRLPRAQFLDLDGVASQHDLGLKHMMPSPHAFAEACEKFGINPSSHVVLYDSQGVFSSPRALFMFRTFGHHRSSVLDGGLPLWEAKGLPIEDSPPRTKVEKTTYPVPSFDGSIIKSYEHIVANSNQDPTTDISAELVLDARSLGRFSGRDPEPRPGLSSGHIPHSFSLPFDTFLETHTAPTSGIQYTTFRPTEDIKKALVSAIGEVNAEHIIKGQRQSITSCGSGMTAGIIWLGLKLLEVERVGLYDESWAGYAGRSVSKIEKTI